MIYSEKCIDDSAGFEVVNCDYYSDFHKRIMKCSLQIPKKLGRYVYTLEELDEATKNEKLYER